MVEAARDKRHPLHHRVFDVPVKLAAERYYRERAHELIQKAKIIYRKTDTSQPITLRAFHFIDHPDGPRFQPLDNVVNDPLLKGARAARHGTRVEATARAILDVRGVRTDGAD